MTALNNAPAGLGADRRRELFPAPKSGLTRWIPLGIGIAVLVIAIIFPYIVDRPRFWLPNIGVKSIWLGIIAMSLVFLNRYVGLLSLAQVTIAGVCAYAIGITTVTWEWPFLAGAGVGIVAGTLAAFLVAIISARTNAIYFLMITLALGQVFFSWASQANEITNGRRGLAPIQRPDFGLINLNDITTFYYVCLAVAVLAYLLCRYASRSTFGLTLQGVRDSPARMSALGYPVAGYRIAATTFAGLIASIGGVIMVLDRNQVDPNVVSLGSTLDVLVVAVIGGIGSLGGVFAGAVIVTLLSNFAQNLTERYMTLTGLVFILVLLFAPAGLAGIGAQVKRFLDRRRPPKAESTQIPAPSDTADQPDGNRNHEREQQ